ncbi:MAG: hypothetical protein LBH12_07330, partial [Dysgonamonadaceae bacterium]|nr:hypothetical protein [Dysgonamonadaceae bacterium]
MKKSIIWLLAGVMMFAFTGLLYLQFNYINIILHTQEEQFKDAVKRSLYQVAYNLDLDEVSLFLSDYYYSYNKGYLKNRQKLSINGTINGLSSDVDVFLKNRRDSLSILPSFGKNGINSSTQSLQEAQNNFLYIHNLVEEVMRRAKKGYEKPIEDRIDSRKLETYIRTELANNNLALPFAYAVSDKEKNIIIKSNNYNA